MSKGRILIIDDDEALSMLITDMFEDNGYEAKNVGSLEEAYDTIGKEVPHLILLDINLPDGTGFELCKELRTKSNVPIIFASARTSEDDKVNGLDMGADDYIGKPYSLKELMSRINSLMRRTYGNVEENNELKICTPSNVQIQINKSKRIVTKNSQVVELAPKEYDLFIYLIDHKGKVLSKDELINNVWGPYSDVEQSTLTVHIRWLREKFEKNPSKPDFIKTAWGVGYSIEYIKE